MLALQVQRPPRGRQYHQARSRGQQRGDDLGGARQLFQVVQHQQGPAVPQMLHHRSRLVPVHGQVAGHGLPHHLAIADGGQGGEVDPVREGAAQRCSGVYGQPSLADTARAGEGHQPYPGLTDEGTQPLEVVFPAHQRRGRSRQVGRGTQALQRREALGQSRAGQLADVFRLIDVLQPVEAQVTDGQFGGQPGLRQLPGDLGHHHLASVRGGRDPRGPVQVHPDVPVFVPGRLA